ncbi:uncharacterized protein LOC144113965 [Amblyomma americanum]
MRAGRLLLPAAAWLAALHTVALATSRYVPDAPGGVRTAGAAVRNVGSSSYTATGVLHLAESSPPEVVGTSRRRAAPRGGALERTGAGDFGVSYIGSPPGSEETADWTDLVVTKLRMQAKPSLGFEPRPTRHRRPPAAPARRRPLHVPRFATAAGGGSVGRSARAKSPRFTYLKTVSYTTFPYYGFGYGPYGFGYSWKPYRPWGMMYGAMGGF